MIACDICIDRSPPKMCSTWWQTMEARAATARRWPSRCSPTSRLGSDRDRSAPPWSVEPAHAVEGAVDGVDGGGGIAVAAVVSGRIGSPGWAPVAVVISGPVRTSSDTSSCSRRGRSSAPSPAPACKVGSRSRCCGRAVRRSGACSRSRYSARPERIDAANRLSVCDEPQATRAAPANASGKRMPVAATFEPSECCRRYLESIVREDVTLKHADDRTVGGRSDEASGCLPGMRGAEHESSRTLVHHPPSVHDVRSLALVAGVCAAPGELGHRGGVASRMAFGTFGPSVGDQLVPSWRSQVF